MEAMKDAIKGRNSTGLQGASTSLGDTITENTQSSGQKKATAANTSLMEFGTGKKGSGPSVGGTSVKASDQIANQSTGTADHLDLGFRKSGE